MTDKQATDPTDAQEASHQAFDALNRALDNPNVPKIYFNGFQNFISNSDLTVVLINNGRPNGILHFAHGTGKSLIGKLAELIQDQEDKSGYYFPSIEDVSNSLNPPQGRMMYYYYYSAYSASQTILQSHETIGKLIKFKQLPLGWNYGEGGPIGSNLIELAAEVVTTGHHLGYKHSDAFPGQSGEIMVTFYEGDHCIEIILENDQSLFVVHEAPGQVDDEFQCLSVADVYLSLEEIRREIWQDLSDPYMRNNMIPGETDLLALHSSPPPRIEAYQSLTPTAQFTNQATFVTTSENTTPLSQAILKSIGNSNQAIYQMAA